MHAPTNAMNWECTWTLSAKITDEEQAHKDTCPETPAWMELGLHAVPSPPPADWELPRGKMPQDSYPSNDKPNRF